MIWKYVGFRKDELFFVVYGSLYSGDYFLGGWFYNSDNDNGSINYISSIVRGKKIYCVFCIVLSVY